MTWLELQNLARGWDQAIPKRIALRFIESHARIIKWYEARPWRTEVTSGDTWRSMLRREVLSWYPVSREPMPRPPLRLPQRHYCLDDYDHVTMRAIPKHDAFWTDSNPSQEMAIRRREEFISLLDVNEVFV